MWNRLFGDTSDQNPLWVTAGPSGEAVVTGNFKGTLSFDATTLTTSGSNTEIFLAKIAP